MWLIQGDMLGLSFIRARESVAEACVIGKIKLTITIYYQEEPGSVVDERNHCWKRLYHLEDLPFSR